MKASELRIGNFVLHDHGVSSVNMIRGNDIGLYDSGLALWGTTIDRVSGIQLTEDWLIKLGLQKLESENEFDKDMYNIYTTSSTGRSLPFFLQKCLNGSYSPPLYHDIHEEIVYVHQLQNLFFALTGKDLTIK